MVVVDRVYGVVRTVRAAIIYRLSPDFERNLAVDGGGCRTGPAKSRWSRTGRFSMAAGRSGNGFSLAFGVGGFTVCVALHAMHEFGVARMFR